MLTDWGKEFYKLPSETEPGFIRYGSNYAIVSPEVVLILKTDALKFEDESRESILLSSFSASSSSFLIFGPIIYKLSL